MSNDDANNLLIQGYRPEDHVIKPMQLSSVIRLDPDVYEQLYDSEIALVALKKAYMALPNPHVNSRPKIRYKLSPKEDTEVTKNRSVDRAMRASRVAMYVRDIIQEPIYAGTPTFDQLKRMHAFLAKDFDTIRVRGDFRDHWIAVEHEDHTNLLYSPPGKPLLASLENWRLWRHYAVGHPIVLAAVSLYQWFLIHPFSDGNGRIGRMISQADLVWTRSLPGMCLDMDAWTRQRMSTYLRSLELTDMEGDFSHLIRMYCQMLCETSFDSAKRANDAKHVFENELLPRMKNDREKKIMWGAMGSPVFDFDWCVSLCQEDEKDVRKSIDDLILRGLLQDISVASSGSEDTAQFYGVRALLHIWDEASIKDSNGDVIWDDVDDNLRIR